MHRLASTAATGRSQLLASRPLSPAVLPPCTCHIVIRSYALSRYRDQTGLRRGNRGEMARRASRAVRCLIVGVSVQFPERLGSEQRLIQHQLQLRRHRSFRPPPLPPQILRRLLVLNQYHGLQRPLHFSALSTLTVQTPPTCSSPPRMPLHLPQPWAIYSPSQTPHLSFSCNPVLSSAGSLK